MTIIASKFALVEAYQRRCVRVAFEAIRQTSPSLQLQAQFLEGNVVDKKAQEILFSDGVTVPFSRNEDAIDTTSKLMTNTPPAAVLVSGCWGCPHFSKCFRLSNNPITEIRRPKLKVIAELNRHGVVDIADIPTGFKLPKGQREYVDLIRNGQSIVDQDGLKESLEQIQNPVRHLDFESVSFAIPLHTDVAPWGHVATQYSIHLESTNGLIHHEFLVEAQGDQRRALAERLIKDLSTEGSIIVWNVAYERARIKEMSVWFPDLTPQLNAIEKRLYDLWPIVKNNVKHPDFHNSYSLKAVAPVLAQGFGYDDLDIAGGGDAQGAMNLMIRGKISAEEGLVYRERLLRYCERDTEATARILQALRDMIA